MAAWEGDLTWIGVGGVGALRVDRKIPPQLSELAS